MGPRPHPEDSDRSLLRKGAPAQKLTVGYFSRDATILAQKVGQRATGSWKIGAYTSDAGARWGESKLTQSLPAPAGRNPTKHLCKRIAVCKIPPIGFLVQKVGQRAMESWKIGAYKNASRARWSQGNLTQWARAPIQRILTVHFSERGRLRKS